MRGHATHRGHDRGAGDQRRADLQASRRRRPRALRSSTTCWPTSASNLFYLKLFAGGDPVLLAAGFDDRVHARYSSADCLAGTACAGSAASAGTVDASSVQRGPESRGLSHLSAVVKRPCTLAAIRTVVAAHERTRGVASYNRSMDPCRTPSFPPSAQPRLVTSRALGPRRTSSTAGADRRRHACGRRRHPAAAELGRRADRPDRRLHHRRRRQADAAGWCCCFRARAGLPRTAHASSWPPSSSSSTPRRCCTTTWSTSPSCVAAAATANAHVRQCRQRAGRRLPLLARVPDDGRRWTACACIEVLADATNVIAEGEVLQLMNMHDPDRRRRATTCA